MKIKHITLLMTAFMLTGCFSSTSNTSNSSQVRPDSLLVHTEYPSLSGIDTSAISGRVNNHIKQTRNYISKETITLPDDTKPELHGSFEVKPYENGVSIVYSLYTYLGGANEETIIKTFTFDKQGNLKKLTDFAPGITAEKIYEGLKNQKHTFALFEKEQIIQGIQTFLKNPTFYVDKNGIIFIFQKYQIAPGSSGIPTIHIPYTYISKNHQTTKFVALTFDDGPHKKFTPQLLAILKKHNVPASFYLLGKNAAAHTDVVKKIADAGHDIGSHSRDHKQLTRVSSQELHKQKERTDDIITKTIGTPPATYRPPYGSKNKTVIDLFNRPLILRNVDTRDRQYRNTKKILANIGTIKNGDIILFHDIYQTSIDAIEPLIVKLKNEGFGFLTISQLLQKNKHPTTGKIICSSGLKCK